MNAIVPEGGGGETIFLSHAVYNNRVSRYRGSNVFQSAEYLSRAMGALYIQYNKKHCVSPKVKSTMEMITYEYPG